MEHNKRKITTECKEGICPICSNQINYGSFELVDEGGTYDWECPACGATGEEGYDLVFDGTNYNVQDADGNDVEISAPAKDEKRDYVIIGRPINGISINGLEYLLDCEDEVMIFDSEEDAKKYLSDQTGYTDEDFDDLEFIHSIGICARCGSPLFPSQIEGYTSQCFTCDEDFFGIEQKTSNSNVMDVRMFEEICEALPQKPGVHKVWSTGEEILSCDKNCIDGIAVLLSTIGISIATGFYDPAEDKAAGIADELTGCYYIYLG